MKKLLFLATDVDEHSYQIPSSDIRKDAKQVLPMELAKEELLKEEPRKEELENLQNDLQWVVQKERQVLRNPQLLQSRSKNLLDLFAISVEESLDPLL